MCFCSCVILSKIHDDIRWLALGQLRYVIALALQRGKSHRSGSMLTFGNIGAFVVATEQEKVLWILDLVAEQEQYRFQTHPATIDVVTQKQKVGRGWESAHLKQSQQIRVLAVYVADNLDGGVELDQRGLRQENLPCCLADGQDFAVLETDALCDFSRISCIQQSRDHVVNVHRFPALVRSKEWQASSR